MNKTKTVILVFLLIITTQQVFSQIKKEKINFFSKDSVQVTADLYLTKDMDAPFIILFHQAMYSRGEYIEIAPILNKMGFNCLAVDQRSGLKVNKIINETHKYAKNIGKKTSYTDAFPDLESSLEYVKKNYSPNKLIIWGSSYSSALVFILAAKHKEIDGLLSFSPGEYFKFENKKISDWAKKVKCPVFVTSSKKEGVKAALIFNKAQNDANTQYIPNFEGNHGSKALWKSNEGHELYWKEVTLFLNKVTE